MVPTALDSDDVPLLSKRNGQVKAARALRQRKDRLEHRLFLAEGAKALSEAMRYSVGALSGVVEVFATQRASREYDALAKAATEIGVPWHLADDAAIDSLTGAVTPQGIVAVCRFLDAPLEQVLAGPADRPIVICVDVRDPGNAGTVIRTADAVGAAGVVLAGQSVDPYNDKTVRATVGSLWHLPVAIAPDTEAVLRAARESGRLVLAADGAGETDLFGADPLLHGTHAWLFGNEAHGLPEDLLVLADHRVAIPIHGRAESLNLSAAAAVCLYASARAR